MVLIPMSRLVVIVLASLAGLGGVAFAVRLSLDYEGLATR